MFLPGVEAARSDQHERARRVLGLSIRASPEACDPVRRDPVGKTFTILTRRHDETNDIHSGWLCAGRLHDGATGDSAAGRRTASDSPGSGHFSHGCRTERNAGRQPRLQNRLRVDVEEVNVISEGETRDVQSINEKLLLESTPGTSPISVLAHLPSVSVTGADPYGAYEWAVRISVRGFNQNQLGFTLDDVPLGDMSYGNLNGLHVGQRCNR